LRLSHSLTTKTSFRHQQPCPQISCSCMEMVCLVGVFHEGYSKMVDSCSKPFYHAFMHPEQSCFRVLSGTAWFRPTDRPNMRFSILWCSTMFLPSHNVLYGDRCLGANHSYNLGQIASNFRAKVRKNPEDL